MKIPRMTAWLFFAAALVAAIAITAPQNVPVVGYKLALATTGAVLGYWIDRGLFPYARPHLVSAKEGVAEGQVAQIRRAIVVAAVIIGITLGL